MPPRTRVSSVVLGAPDAPALASFWERLLGWERVDDEPEWVKLRPPGGGTGMSFQHEESYVPPVWPGGPGDQRMTAHVDVAAEDLDATVAWALANGATLAAFQPQDDVRVLLDPAGHPFCLFAGTF